MFTVPNIELKIQKCVLNALTKNQRADTNAHSMNKDVRLLKKLWRSTVIQHSWNYKHSQDVQSHPNTGRLLLNTHSTPTYESIQ